METRVLTATDPVRDAAAIREAARAIADGALVVFPTETVYGIAANATSAAALAALSDLKSRTPDKPFTLHLADPQESQRYAGPLPLLARRLIHKAWPGPLTLVLPDRRPHPPGRAGLIEDERGATGCLQPVPFGKHGSPGVTRGTPGRAGLIEEAIYYRGTVGLRCPADRVGRAILRAAGVPVAGSSANLAGHKAPRRVDDLLADLEGKVPLVIDAGPTALARASTVVRVREDDTYEVLREEAITARRLERLARTRILFVCTGNLCRSPMAAGIAGRMLADRLGFRPGDLKNHGIEVQSAGTSASAGLAASANAIEAMRERGIDIRGHLSRPITVDAILAADYIWVMTQSHYEVVLRMAPEAAGRAALLDPRGQSVADPIGGDLGAYRACANHLERAVAARLTETA